MGKKIRYTNELPKAEIIPDSLPPPDQLAVREDPVKVTISLSRRSVGFFKAAAERNHTSYQRIIRRLLDTSVRAVGLKHRAAQHKYQMAKLRVVAVLAATVIAGCSGESTDPDWVRDDRTDVERGYASFQPEWVSPGDGGPEVATYEVLRSEDEWRGLWLQIEPRMSRNMTQRTPHPLPVIDFTEKAVIVAALGRRSDSGYSVKIDSVTSSPERVVIKVMEELSGKNCIRLLAETQPMVLALIPQTAKPVEFDVGVVTVDCGK